MFGVSTFKYIMLSITSEVITARILSFNNSYNTLRSTLDIIIRICLQLLSKLLVLPIVPLSPSTYLLNWQISSKDFSESYVAFSIPWLESLASYFDLIFCIFLLAPSVAVTVVYLFCLDMAASPPEASHLLPLVATILFIWLVPIHSVRTNLTNLIKASHSLGDS